MTGARAKQVGVAAKWLSWFWLLGGFAYLMYGWFTETGLFWLLAEAQMAIFGVYFVKATMLVSFFVVFFLPLMIAQSILETQIGVKIVLFPVAPKLSGVQLAEHNERSAHKSLRALAVVGLLAIVVAVLSGYLGFRKSQEPIVFEPFDLAKDEIPKTSHVALTAIAHPRMRVTYRHSSNGSLTIIDFTPLTSPTWTRDKPIRYFLRSHEHSHDKSEEESSASDTKPFVFQEQGALVRDDLPNVVAKAFTKGGILLATPPIVLDTNADENFENYLLVSIMSGFLGVGAASGAVGVSIARYVSRRRNRKSIKLR